MCWGSMRRTQVSTTNNLEPSEPEMRRQRQWVRNNSWNYPIYCTSCNFVHWYLKHHFKLHYYLSTPVICQINHIATRFYIGKSCLSHRWNRNRVQSSSYQKSGSQNAVKSSSEMAIIIIVHPLKLALPKTCH